MEINSNLEEQSIPKEVKNDEMEDTNALDETLNKQEEDSQSETQKRDELEAKLKHCQEELLRCLAEAQNMRNRYEAQIIETKKYAVTGIAKEIINIMDNLDMALKNEKADLESLKQTIAGVKLTKTQLENIFTKFKIKKIEPKTGDPFDYEMHHAVSRVSETLQKEGTIIQVMQVGYKIEDRLLRAALVSVATEA